MANQSERSRCLCCRTLDPSIKEFRARLTQLAKSGEIIENHHPPGIEQHHWRGYKKGVLDLAAGFESGLEAEFKKERSCRAFSTAEIMTLLVQLGDHRPRTYTLCWCRGGPRLADHDHGCRLATKVFKELEKTVCADP